MNPGRPGGGGPAVVLLGDVMTDLVARLDGPLVPAGDSPARISVEGGGAAANTAAWLAGLGVRTVLLGRVGDDAAGRSATGALRAAGVETRFAVDRERPTGTVIVLVEPGGERTMVPDAGANAALAAEDLPTQVFRRAAHLHLSGYTLLRPGSRGAGLAALGLARAAGMTVSVDAASAGPLEAAGAARFLSWIGGIEILFANLPEARTLARASQGPSTAVTAAVGSSPLVHGAQPRTIGSVLTEHCRLAVVKLGAEGALACTSGGECEHVGAVPLDPGAAVDSTGAGDAFAAGFLRAWLAGRPVGDALRSGSALAARAVSGVGARPALPSIGTESQSTQSR
ncbi:carbohydrate kinase family protein [Actinocrinis puniceicyclus]|uniref:Carbohydrate kinase family protein n=1 Tax=Actinocrinis puniceicyclus TaxID=977794 RepID=A0A8J8BB85_9ACTN|nr:carbohydrate kinase family protein [Actinocrinis puniceicyclus]MBS2963772.1 carbohydrate kinase family protein [Actinocrinis puniceicyclus]